MDINQTARKVFSIGRRQALAGAITGIAAPVLSGGQVGEAKKGKGKNKNKNKNKNKTRCNRCPQQACCSCLAPGNVPVACSLIEPGEDVNATSARCGDFCKAQGIGDDIGEGVHSIHPSADNAPFCTTENRCVQIACPVI